MGFRFRKSITIFPGVRVNFSKSGASLSLGRKGAHFTMGTNGRKTASVGIPGTGVSYSKTFGTKKKKGKTTGNAKEETAAAKPEEAAAAAGEEETYPGERRTREIPWLVVGLIGVVIVLLIVILVMLIIGHFSKKNTVDTIAPAAVAAEVQDSGGGGGSVTGTGDSAAADTGTAGDTAKKTKFVVNTSTKKFHKPGCSSAKSSSNTKTMITTRDELIKEGYSPCSKCNP